MSKYHDPPTTSWSLPLRPQSPASPESHSQSVNACANSVLFLAPYQILQLTTPPPNGTCFFSDVPKEQRLQAVQAAIMLMSDENREVLQTLLCFLSDVTSVEENQMTPMNVAVCLAPSLFHLNIVKKESSPRQVSSQPYK